jgi:exosome complex protein LRP1
MSTETTKIRSKLAKLDKSLDQLESQLEPLLAQSLPESLLALDTIQQAKLQVVIPYVVYDLVFGEPTTSNDVLDY